MQHFQHKFLTCLGSRAGVISSQVSTRKICLCMHRSSPWWSALSSWYFQNPLHSSPRAFRTPNVETTLEVTGRTSHFHIAADQSLPWPSMPIRTLFLKRSGNTRRLRQQNRRLRQQNKRLVVLESSLANYIAHSARNSFAGFC